MNNNGYIVIDMNKFFTIEELVDIVNVGHILKECDYHDVEYLLSCYNSNKRIYLSIDMPIESNDGVRHNNLTIPISAVSRYDIPNDNTLTFVSPLIYYDNPCIVVLILNVTTNQIILTVLS